MAFRERTVTGYVVDADGAPVQGGTISFQLDKPLGYTSTHVVINRIFTATTDALGAFTVTLWCDDDSLTALNYTVSFPIANSGQPQSTHTATISLAYQDGSPKDLGTLIAESQPPPTTVPESTWRSLIQSEIAAAILDNLSDVVIASPANGQVLTFDSVSGKWKNQAGAGGGLSGGVTDGLTKWTGASSVGLATGLSQASGKQLVVTAQAASDKPFVIQLAANPTANAIEILNSALATIFKIDQNGDLYLRGTSSQMRMYFSSTTGLSYHPLNGFVSVDGAGISISAADPFINLFSSSDLSDRIRLTSTALKILRLMDGSGGGGAALELIKMAADPAAPAANMGRLFLRDNGAGKTQLAVRFPTGAVQVIATEP